ncbi:TolB family protein [Frateuria sp. GZRe12]|uniref:TolB family protein n=1 Tax=Frateuria sp. GZRe12 TaxID=3351533 RepID=UPI003EDC0381
MSIRFLSTAVLGLICCTGSVHASDDATGPLSKSGSPSPDGSTVVFEADMDGTDGAMHLWMCNLDGSDLHRIVTSALSEGDPAWSPDGSRIAFEALGPDGNTDLWLVNPDGSGLVQLTHGLDNKQPAWSPDGRQIAYTSNAGGTNDIWIMDADGQNAQRLTSLPGEEDHPSFSPAGDRVVFSETDSSDFTANLQIVASTPGAVPRPLTSAGFHDWNPSWGSLGIVFASDRVAPEGYAMMEVQPDGSGLSGVGNVRALDPVWTRDGRIVFTDEVNVAPALAAVSLYDPATGQRRRIVRNVLKVSIDIKPESDANEVNPDEHGKLWVAVLSQEGLAAPDDVDQTTLSFGGTGAELSLVDCRKQARDLNGDGRDDLECRFDVRKAALSAAAPKAILRFRTKGGALYEGQDAFVAPATR